MNKSKKPKESNKAKAERLTAEVQELKKELFSAQHSASNTIDVLHRRLVASERIAYDTEGKAVCWFGNPPTFAPSAEIKSGRAKEIMAVIYDDPGRDYMPNIPRPSDAEIRHELCQRIADIVLDNIPMQVHHEPSTGVTRYLVSFWALAIDPSSKKT